MIILVVYADILIILNLIVNYFLLLAVKRFLCSKAKIIRIILSAAFGGVSSLYIFLPQSAVIFELLYKLVICIVMTLLSFGYKSLKYFLKASGTVFCVTCLYAGIMIAVWHIFKPDGMIINNSVVYFNISPLILICSTVAFYLTFTALIRIFSGTSKAAEKCEITLFAEESKVSLNAIIDTGNSIEDIFGKSEVIIADKSVYYSLFGERDISTDDSLKKRYRVVPCTTVTGMDTLDGYRCERADIKTQSSNITIKKPILAISKEALCDGYEAIVNPKIFN